MVAHINYQCLRGKVHAVAPAQPPTNPHLWILLEANGEQWFATINVRSDKDAPGEPVGKSYLYYLVDTDFEHPYRTVDPCAARGPVAGRPLVRRRSDGLSAGRALRPDFDAGPAAGRPRP